MKHLSLLIHCMTSEDEASKPLVNDVLYISVKDLEAYILELKSKGNTFCLPFEAHKFSNPTVSFSFDDGQRNNRLFIPLAEKYKIPFIIFVSTFYIQNQKPFPWDKEPGQTDDLVKHEAHKPFSEAELKDAMKCEFMYLAPHGHSHRPFLKISSSEMEDEVKKDLDFLASFPRVLVDDFAFPNGHFTSASLKWAGNKFKRIYTIEGADGSTATLINRVSLINPQFGGSFDKQIKRTESIRFKLARKYVHLKAYFS